MIVQDREGKVIARNVYAFNEQKFTLKYVKDVDRLKRLHQVRLEQDRASLLVQELCGEFKLTMPKIRFTGYTDCARYWDWRVLTSGEYESQTIVIRQDYISTQILIHELTHHWIFTKMVGREDRSHGYDFATRLEKLAVAAERMLEEGL